jgi:hypothetical protein
MPNVSASPKPYISIMFQSEDPRITLRYSAMLPVESEDSSLAYGMKQFQTHFRRSKLSTIPHREMRCQNV